MVPCVSHTCVCWRNCRCCGGRERQFRIWRTSSGKKELICSDTKGREKKEGKKSTRRYHREREKIKTFSCHLKPEKRPSVPWARKCHSTNEDPLLLSSTTRDQLGRLWLSEKSSAKEKCTINYLWIAFVVDASIADIDCDWIIASGLAGSRTDDK